MESTKQPVLAGGLLDALSKIFFKGIENILDAAAEYEEEFGVLKQKTVLNLQDQSNGKVYTLTVKLSPVKDKDSFYYVEAETTAPGLDVSSINEKTLKIDKTTKEKFNEIINKLLEEHNLKIQNDENNEEDSQDIDSIIEQINKDLEDMVLESEDPDSPDYEVKGEVTKNNNKLLLKASLSDGQDETEEKTADIEFLDPDDGSILSIDEIEESIIDKINEMFQEETEDADDQEETTASTIVRATFIKSSKTNKISLRAITATIDIEDALDIAYDVADDDDFANSLGSEPESYEIIETAKGYDVNRIDSIQ